MIGNGTRVQRITDWHDDRFVTSAAEVRRFRCRDCGVTTSLVSPDLEPGFRMSRIAADRIVDSAVNGGITRCAQEASIDGATVSRLVSAKVDKMLLRTERPRMAQLDIVDGAGLLVSDAMTGKTAVVFSGCDDARLIPWLSRPYPGVLVPDVKAAPRILKLADRFILAMPAMALMEAVRPLLSRAAARLEAFTGTTRETATKIASIVTSTGGMYREGEIASPGTPGRHFIRLCSTLFDALSSSDIGAGRRAIGSWIENCRDAWASVFSPVLRFFEAFSPLVFSHPICLEPPRPLAKLEFTGPANVLSLALDRQKSTTTLRPQEPRLNMSCFA